LLKPYLVIFDDQISSSLLTSKNSTLINLACIGRHYLISTVLGIQRYKSVINPIVRDQFTRICIFKQGNKRSLLDLLSDYDESDLDVKQGLQ